MALLFIALHFIFGCQRMGISITSGYKSDSKVLAPQRNPGKIILSTDWIS
jgi:hypothetical protein